MDLRARLSFFLASLGMIWAARLLNNGHWYDYSTKGTIFCTCGLESAYWQDAPHPYY